ncbi:hypothetical protein CBW65_14710 [Tumebacillus avium]|uniref:DUF5067 domain-containing protein n=1 Tax=Tumebacillus avium TaxID=1903704 RepID=A0A1Y0IP98_9BACL|nr:hypothetical protein [Tumebacillus avium]ARU62110.1 hypothetical protein CBW65_14710 [Tumebacillus avium]
MRKLLLPFASLVVGFLILSSGCSENDTGIGSVVENSESNLFSEITLQKVRTQTLELVHLDQTYKGIEYQFYFQIADRISTEETLKRIQVEIVFNGKTKELINVESLKKTLDLVQDEHGTNTYVARVSSVYKTEYTEAELNYLIDHPTEVDLYLYVDGEKVRKLQ